MSENAYSILTDTTRCIGCEKCVEGCKKANDLGDDVAWRWKAKIDDLSSTRFTKIIQQPGKRFIRQHCHHCQQSACVSACIVGALKKQEEGAVTYDETKCMGCRYCMMACPFGIPRYDWEAKVPYVRKCILCYDKLTAGELEAPGCVSACPEKATIFGTRDEMLDEARRRIDHNPEKYIDHIYGEKEVGGASVLYLSDIDLGFLGWQNELGDKTLPERTWKALSKVPYMAVGMGAGMFGIWWMIGRRMELQVRTKAALEARVDKDAAAAKEEEKND